MPNPCGDKVIRLGMSRSCQNQAIVRVYLQDGQSRNVCERHAKSWQKLGRQFGYEVKTSSL